MKTKRVDIFLLVLLSLIIAGFATVNIKNGLNAWQVEALQMRGNILYVGGIGANNYTNIQDAIDDATDGDTIFVYSGIYYENVVINKRITLIGENKETTIIDGSNTGNVIKITTDGVNVEVFGIHNGGDWPDAGIKINNANNVTISNCNIYSNNYYGIWLSYSSTNSISNCNIYSNNYYGIELYYSSTNSISNCNIYSNNYDGIGLDYSSTNTISNCNISNNHDGIWLSSSSNNTISNCNISNNDLGIGLDYSSNNNIVSNCNISNNWGGIELLYSSNNNIVSNCNISNNDLGIVLWYSSTNSISNCNISNNYDGIGLDYSSNNTISNCNIYSNGNDGIWLYYSSNNTISYCNFINDGIIILGGETLSHFIHNIYNNTVNEKPLLYYKNENNIVLDGIEAGEIILANCSNFEIRNINISNTDVGIEIAFSSNTSISNCNIYSNNYDGIYLSYSSSNNISNCNIYSNNYDGIYLSYSSSNNISNCNIYSNNYDGIELYYSSSNNISNCNIYSNNYDGIELYYSSSNNISNCNIYSNNYDGIWLYYSFNNSISNCNIYSNNWDGIDMDYSSNNTVIGCNVYSNNDNGIELYSLLNEQISNCNIYSNGNDGVNAYNSSNNNITNCSIYNNSYYGIYLYNSSNNLIYNNYFNNTNNAYDECNNIWNISKTSGTNVIGGPYLGGNYWSDYNGSDADGDGIGDINLPYNCSGNIQHGGDWLPLIEPNYAPVANFSYTPLNPTTADIINFTDLSNDLDGFITNWTWNFGDGNYSYQQNPTHQYSDDEIYNVTLIVTDDDGANDTISKNITVIKPATDYILITFSTKNEIFDYNISTNFSFIAHASAFNNTYGFIEFVDANWSILNYDSNTSINTTQGKSILFNSGWNDGTAILQAEYNGYTDSVVFVINSSLFSFFLYKGWNLITLPCENSYNASSLFNDIKECSIILGWNASTGDFNLYVPGSPYDFVIENGHGYFVGMSYDSIFSLVDIPVENVSVPLYTGWNMLGWFKENETTASSLYNAIENCSIVLKWNSSLQNFDLYAPGTPDFAIKRGDGFLIAVDEQSIWHGEG
ncbi:MAG TPA: PKD domain-containing protein [Thermoplasmatales archaeon]|nr:PKD domain-containing protein [Thermoplasmatales archaeon]